LVAEAGGRQAGPKRISSGDPAAPETPPPLPARGRRKPFAIRDARARGISPAQPRARAGRLSIRDAQEAPRPSRRGQPEPQPEPERHAEKRRVVFLLESLQASRKKAPGHPRAGNHSIALPDSRAQAPCKEHPFTQPGRLAGGRDQAGSRRITRDSGETRRP
jgi:hypothetical protein